MASVVLVEVELKVVVVVDCDSLSTTRSFDSTGTYSNSFVT